MDCSPAKVTLPPKRNRNTKISDYREELIATLSSARALAFEIQLEISTKICTYKQQHDKKATTPKFHVRK